MSEITNSIAFLKQQQWVDLSHNIYGGIPYFQSFQPMREKTLVTVKEDGFLRRSINWLLNTELILMHPCILLRNVCRWISCRSKILCCRSL